MKCAKMKVGLGALAVVTGLVVALLGFTKAGGLAEVAWNKLGLAANQAVPIGVELDRLDLQVKNITEDIKSSTSALIKEEVATDRLREEVKDTKATLDKRLEELTKLNAALESGETFVKIGSQSFPAEKVRTKFNQDWAGFKSAKAALEAKEKLIEQKQKQIDTARARIDELKSQQDQLRTEVAKMRADLEAAKLAQAQSPVQVDESRLADIKTSLKDVRDRITVMTREAELQGEVIVKEPTVEDALKNAKAEDEFKAFVNSKKGDK